VPTKAGAAAARLQAVDEHELELQDVVAVELEDQDYDDEPVDQHELQSSTNTKTTPQQSAGAQRAITHR
jgi:hypothetical protein